eukprot:6200490-Pleurochrysis_carterae.AAC.2
MFSFDSDTAYDPAKIDKITEIYYEQESPEASMYLPRNDDMTLVREMITIPTDGNDAEDVQFELPQNVSYSGPSDLIYMGVMDMASLIQSRTVSCVDVITTFRDRLEEFAFLGVCRASLPFQLGDTYIGSVAMTHAIFSSDSSSDAGGSNSSFVWLTR